MFPGTVILAVVAIVFTVLPAVGVVPRNSLFGMRIPGARDSDQAWRRVHRHAMPYAFVGAIAGIGCGLVARANPGHGYLDQIGFYVVLAGIIIGAIVGAVMVRR